MHRDSSPAGKLLEDGAQHTCSGLFLLGEEIAVESYDSNIFSPSLIAQAINHQGAIICLSLVAPSYLPPHGGPSYLRYVFPTPGFPEQNNTGSAQPSSVSLHFVNSSVSSTQFPTPSSRSIRTP